MLYLSLLVAVAIAAFFAGAHNAKRAASLKAAAKDAAKAVSK
jgi:hypothetical protein